MEALVSKILYYFNLILLTIMCTYRLCYKYIFEKIIFFFFENKNLFWNFSLKWFLCEGCLKMKF